MFELDFLPVGDGERSGDAIALRYSHPETGELVTGIIDAGFEDDGDALVAHFHDYYGTNRADFVLITHPDSDHINGAGAVLRELDVGALLIHRPSLHGYNANSGARPAEELARLAVAQGSQVLEPFVGVHGFGGSLYKLHDHARLLRRFGDRLDTIGAEFVTIELALAWALEPEVPPGSVVPAMRLLVVRGFARYMSGVEPRTEIPPTGLIRFRQRRRAPFIYSDAEIEALMQQARTGIRQALCAATYETLIGLLAATGMRISEAIKLDRTDVDWAEGVLLVRESKFNKSRYVPLHESTLEALARYARRRDELCPDPRDPSFFVSLRRTRLYPCAVHKTFRRLCELAGVGAEALVHRDCTICGIRRPSRRCWAGIAAASMFSRGCLPSPPISGIAIPPTPTTTSQQRRSSWPVPPVCSTPPRRRSHDPHRSTLQAFFSDRLVKQLDASPRTIGSYRDTLTLLLRFVHDTTGKAPSALEWDELDEPVIAAFLEHLETERHNSARTRNLRLTAIRALFQYAAMRHPEHAAVIGRVLSIPPKRFQRRTMTFLTTEESQALIDAPPQERWEGRRDRSMLTLAIQAGLRVSELVAVNCGDVTLGSGGSVHVEGKGRKHRAVPLTNEAKAVIAVWIAERGGDPGDPLFPTRTGRRLSRDAVERRVAIHVATATNQCASLQGKRVHPHVLRHSCAMALLHAGVDSTVIALWLGHYAGDPVKRRERGSDREAVFRRRGAGRLGFVVGRCG